MKKYLSIVLAFILILTFAACRNQAKNEQVTPTPEESGFVAPKNYVAVIKITINPEFNLYVDSDGTVLAIEPVNDDAKSIISENEIQTGSIETVMENIVIAANKGGFVKENATVEIKLMQRKDNSDDAPVILDMQPILDKAEESTKNAVKSLGTVSNINISITAEETPVNTDAVVTPTNAPTAIITPTPTPKPTEKTTAKPTVKPTAKPTPTPKPTEKPVYTSIEKKAGKWAAKYLDGKTLYSASFSLTGKMSVGVGLGDLINSNDLDMWGEEFCEKYDGNYYYFGRGDGDDLTNVEEKENNITATDSRGEKIVFVRTGENTLKVVSIDAEFAQRIYIPVGTVFTYSVE